MSAKYKSPSFLLPNELNTSANPANDTGINSLYSMDFDSSSSDYIDLGNPTELQLTGAFSISLWIKMNSTGDHTIISKDNNTSNPRGFNIGISNTYPGGYINLFNGTTVYGVYIASSDPNYVNLRDNNWHHITAVYTPSTSISFFVDGNFIKSNTTNIPASVNFVNNNLNIGRKPQSGGIKYFNGKIDEVAIFNRALNTTEIAALYGGTSPNIYPSNLMATDLNPIAYYPLGEQAQMQGYLGNEASSEWQFPNGVLQDYVMDFDGSDDYITLNSINLGTTNTISFWYNGETNTWSTVLGNDDAFNDYTIIVESGNVVWYKVEDALNGNIKWSVANVNDGNWHHFAFFRTNTTIKLYIDGNLQTVSNNTLVNNDTKIDTIGAKTDGTMTFKGKLSNVAIWNTDQSANVANIYNNGSPQTSYTVTPQNWWKLNADSVYTPSAPNYTTALDFVASESDYISFPDISFTGEFTISFWMNPDSFYGVVVGDSSNANWLRIANATQTTLKNNNQAGTTWESGVTFTTGEWQHVVLRRDSSNVCTIFRNGIHYTNNSPTRTGTFGPLNKIGQKANTNYFDGQLSNIAIFNTALTSSQVSTLFNFGTPEVTPSFSPQAWWKLDNTTTGIQDSSGNGNNGTNNGASEIPSGVAAIPSWKIPSALTIPTINYTTAGSFNGTSSKIVTTEENLGTTNTISFWHKRPTGMGNNKVVIGGNTSNRYDGTIILNGTSLRIGFPTDKSLDTSTIFSASANASGVNIPYEDVWIHYCITRNGTTQSDIKLYVNSYLVTSSRSEPFGAVDYTTDTTVFNLGAASAQSRFSEGELSNISTFSSAFTQAQVNTLYNNGQPSADISSLSPVNWWKLDTIGATITDNGSAGNNGTNTDVTAVTTDVKTSDLNIPVNGVSTTLPSTALQQSDLQFDSPYSNYSLSFDGTGDYIDCGDSDIFSFTNGTTDLPFSVSAWIKVGDTGINRIVNKVGGSDAEWLFSTGTANRTLVLNLYSSGATTTGPNRGVAGSTSLNSYVNQWVHVACSYDGRGNNDAYDGMKLYLNGQLETTTNIIAGTYTSMANGIAPLRIGSDIYFTNYYFNGNIDETSIFNYELTEAQVLEIYNNGKPSNLDNFSGTAPISWWRLGENAYFDNNSFVVPNSITGAPNGTGSGTITTMISADAPGTYANGIGENLAILDRVGDAPLSTSNSQSYNMIPDDKVPYVPGYVGNQIANNFSMSFDSASSNYIDVGNITALNNLSSFSSSSWFKCTAVSTAPIILNGGSSSTNKFYLQLLTNGTTIRYVIGSSVIDTSVSNIADGNWHHIATTQNGTSLDIYLDGVKQNTSTITVVSPSTNIGNNFKIGRYFLSAANYFDGLIDEVAIFDTALNAGQIYNDIYQPTATGTNQTADFVNNPNLPNPVAWYRMGD